MAQRVESRSRTFQVHAPLKAHRLVKVLATGKINYAGAEDLDAVGFTTKETFAADEFTPVDLINAEGTQIAEAHSAIEIGDPVYQAAAGRLDDAGTVKRGIALSAAGEQGDWFEMLVEREALGAEIGDGMQLDITVEAGVTTDAMIVTIEVQDSNGDPIEAVHALEFWFSDAATGIGLSAATLSGALTAVSTFGAIHTAITAKLHALIVTNASGVAKLQIVASANPATMYPVAKNPRTGAVVVGPVSNGNWEGFA